VKRCCDPIRRARWTTATLAVLVLAGCAGPSNPGPSTGNHDADAVLAAQASAQAQAPATGTGDAAQGSAQSGGGAPGGRVELWAVQSGALGVLVTDGDGRPIYRFDRDGHQPPSTTCTGSCTDAWPPVLIGNQPPDLEGVNAALVGSIVRPDGQRQLTLAGWPLYKHAGDDGALSSTYGNGDDNAWFVIAPNGDHAMPR
jgi:predicted lipoprotein with Yx(FWY)xxD motif